jgi:hypothetical protein
MFWFLFLTLLFPGGSVMDHRIELVKQDTRVQVVGELEDRLLLQMDPKVVEVVEPFKSGRSGQLDNTMLAKSIKTRLLYPPLLYIAIVEGIIHYQIADGLQRLLAALDNGTPLMVFQWLIDWTNPQQAFEDATSANSVRHELQRADILSLFRAGISVMRMSEISAVPETELRRLERISRHPELDDPVKRKLISISILSSCLEKCQGDRNRERRFVNFVTGEVADADKKATAAQVYLDQHEGQHVDSAQKRKADPATHLKSIKWDAVRAELIKKNQSGPLVITRKKSNTIAIRIGDAPEWGGRLALYGPFGQTLDKVTAEDLQLFDDSLPLIRRKLRKIIEQKRRESAATTKKKPTPEEEDELVNQDDDFEVGDDADLGNDDLDDGDDAD